MADMQPGEARKVAQGTEVVYTLPSGSNRLVLPPLYVSAPHIVAVTPTAQTTGAGGTVFFDVLLTNPGTAPDTYTLTVAGLPDGWAQLAATADVPAGSEMTVPMTVTVPDDAPVQMLDFAVGATNGTGGQDQATATLIHHRRSGRGYLAGDAIRDDGRATHLHADHHKQRIGHAHLHADVYGAGLGQPAGHSHGAAG